MPIFFKQTTLDGLLKLNSVDHLFLRTIKDKSFNDIEFFKRINSRSTLDFVMKIAHHSPDFVTLCKKEQHRSFWEGMHTLLGLYISANENKTTLFFMHENTCAFDVVRGDYFFYLSQIERKLSNKDFSINEILLLKQSIEFNSILATRRYQHYVYTQINTHLITDKDEQQYLLKECIKNGKKMTDSYGSYAYLMLADAYVQYATWAIEQGDWKTAQQAVNAGTKSCALAQQYLEKSERSIHNASLGSGLASSNSFAAASPQAANEWIAHWWENQKAVLSQGYRL